MSRKKIIISVIGLIIIIIAGYAAMMWFSDDRTYNRELNKARNAVAVQDWQTAKQHYQASRKVRVSIENRTASEQLDYLARADKAIKQQNWESAKSLYQRAIDTNGGIPLLKKAAKTNQRIVNAEQDSGKYKASVSSLEKSLDKKDKDLNDLKKQMSDTNASVQAVQDSANKAVADANAAADKANATADSANKQAQDAQKNNKQDEHKDDHKDDNKDK